MTEERKNGNSNETVKNNKNNKNNQNKKRKYEFMTVKNDVFLESSLKKLKSDFEKNPFNKVVQNSLCSNYLDNVSEVREYMQSRDRHFSHTIQPKLHITNQGMSGRCWMFAVLNVIRHELIIDLNLPHNFELSESYLSFYEKIEKCNYFLTQFMNIETIDVKNDSHIRNVLNSGIDEGGFWVSCANLIKKYGLVPKSSFLESVNSFDTENLNKLLNTKLREFSKVLVDCPIKEREQLKSKMMEELYGIISKMCGTPPCPDEEFEWTYLQNLDMVELLEIEKERKESGTYKPLELKKVIKMTPLEFYNKFVSKKLEDHLCFSNDPRNEYGKYYESHDDDCVIGAERVGYFNIEMEYIEQMAITSILNNTPVMFCCDVGHYMNINEELFDTKCFDYNMLFNTTFNSLNKKEMMEVYESRANHAMVLVGVDLDLNTGLPLKWKVENSWGKVKRDEDNESGYFTMSSEWFRKYVYDIVIHKDFLHRKELTVYNKAKKNKITLPKYDIMA